VLDLETRTAILRLHAEGHSKRFIARTVRVSREAVQRVIVSGDAVVPPIDRSTQLEPHVDRVRELHAACRGNLVRVHEELAASGVVVAYSTLTRFCRERQIGHAPPRRAGRYVFEPGQEMQHDTSPHTVEVGGRTVRLQCASLVLCFSHRRFVQCYPRFTRFHARAFLTAALRHFGGAADQCMVDNSTVILAGGTGPNAIVSPEMIAFSERFDFDFVAHEAGDANRSARVERPFHHVENNFYPGRTFTDLADLNAQLLAWCDVHDRAFHRSYQAVPMELFAVERQALKPLPAFVPEPTDVHLRRVDTEGYVCLHTNRYSVADALIGQDVEVHETLERVRVFVGHRLHVEHGKRDEGRHERVTLPEHRGRWRERRAPLPPSKEEAALRAAGPALAALCDALRARAGGQALKPMRRLHRMWLDYPTDAVVAAADRALEFGLVDLDRIERMVLRNVRGEFFRLPMPDVEGDDG
jgi:hypothetical protein